MTKFAFAVFSALIMSFQPTFASRKKPSRPVQKTWNAKMQEMSKTISALIPYLFNDRKFKAPANAPIISKYALRLNTLAHDVEKLQPAQSEDPAAQYIAQQFKGQVERAYESLKSGNREYAKYELRTSVSYCISCHTLTNTGPQFRIKNFDRRYRLLSPMDRMAFLAATRHYDAALEEYSNHVLRLRRISPIDLERATRIAMAVSVRVKNNPQQTLLLLKKVSRHPRATGTFRDDLSAWKADIQEWAKEKPQQQETEKEMLTTAHTLIQKAHKLQGFQMDARGDVEYLRASAILHDFLRDYPNSPQIGEALYLSGQCYDSLRDLGFWSLHEMYYEACILKAQHTALGQKCFARLKSSLIEGYTGSRGLSMPASVQKKLSTLEELAAPLKNQHVN